jgi:hypothetical protein
VAVGDALLVGVAQEGFEGSAVLVDPVREWIAVELVALHPRIGREPRQRIARHGHVGEAAQAQVPRLDEGVVEAAGDPGVALEDRFLDRDHVHDRPDLGARVVRLFHLQIIGK